LAHKIAKRSPDLGNAVGSHHIKARKTTMKPTSAISAPEKHQSPAMLKKLFHADY